MEIKENNYPYNVFTFILQLPKLTSHTSSLQLLSLTKLFTTFLPKPFTMAEAILFNLTADIILKLGSSALRQLGSLWRVNDDLDKLKDSLSAIQAVLHDAEEKQFKDHAVKDWVLKLEEVLYQIDDLIDESSYETLRRQVLAKDRRKRKQVRILFSKFKSNWKIGHEIKEIRQRLQAINDVKNQFSFSKHVIERRDNDEGLRKRRETHSFIPEDEVIGRNDDKEAVIDLLLNSNTEEDIAIVSIVGMGGLGKTALAQSIYNNKRITTQFQLKLWVCVSEEFDLKIIIQKIIESATKKKPESFLQIDSLQRELRKEIDGKKYLLVMDDVWNEEQKHEWLHLKELLMGGAKGSRILITTRSEQVAKTFDSTSTHSLQILDVSNSWLLFQKMTGLEGCSNIQEVEFHQKNSILIQIGKEIVSRLKGVPLVIRTIGGLLKDNKSERFWLSFKDKELYQVLGQGQDGLKQMQLILELSYKHLPLSNLKQCFLYCALFPKDYEIKKDELILLWRAQGFIQPNGNGDNNYLADIGDDYFMKLLSRSFFQEVEKDDFGDIRACKMHDLMHDLACSITKNEYVRKLEDNVMKDNVLKGNVIDKRTRHLFLEKDIRIEDQLMRPLSKATHLRTFFSPDYGGGSPWNIKEIIFCNNIFRLRALHLPLYGEIEKFESLEFIGKLKHLRYLSITNSKITYISDSITRLYNLETFIFQHSQLKTLPNDVGNLINLKHLDLSYNCSLEFLPNSITELCKLEALILQGCFILIGLPEYARLIKSKRLDLDRCSRLSHMPKGLGELTNLQTMDRFVLGKNKGGELKELDGLTKLRGKLSIEHLEFCTSIDQQMKGKFLQLKSGLQELELHWEKHTIGELEDVIYESVLDCLQPHSNLQKILIDGYNGVKLCNWVSSKFLGCLVTVGLYNCERLQHLPQFHQFPNLKHLYLYNLPNIEYIIVNNDDSVSSSTIFPSLKTLLIIDMPKLVRWCKGTTLTKSPIIISDLEDELDVVPLKNYENLTSLYLINLGKWEYLPEWIDNLTSLTQLKIVNWKKLTMLPEGIGNLTSLTQLKIVNCEKLTMLPEGIGNLASLTQLTIVQCEKLTMLPKGIGNLTSLTKLKISSCKKLALLPEEIGNLISLSKLKISSCKKLALLPEGISNLTSLTELKIFSCEKLTLLPEGIGNLISLTHLKIVDCENLTMLPEGIGNLTSLTQLKISSCENLVLLPEGIDNLTSLTQLKILDCKKLTTLPEGIGNLTSLTELKIYYCGKLALLPEGIRDIHNLQYLTIHGCPILKERCKEDTGEDWPKIAHIPNISFSDGFLSRMEMIHGAGPEIRAYVADYI